MQGELKQVALREIFITPHNPRHIPKGDPRVRELAESIRATGLLQPVICRPADDGKGKGESAKGKGGKRYELLAGARRFLAHELIGAGEIMAIVRDLDDKTAIEVTVLENLQRENLTPLEEARGIRALLDSGQDARTIAAEIGKSPAFVARRAHLMNLAPELLKRLDDPEDALFGLPAAHLEIVARFDHKTQVEFVETADFGYFKHEPAGELEQEAARFTAELKKAAFDTADEDLVSAAGSCRLCLKRSSVNPLLWDMGDDQAEIKKADKCLDAACWKAKEAAHLERREAALRRDHPKLVKVVPDRSVYGEVVKGALRSWEYSASKKGDTGAEPAIVVAGPGAGKLAWIRRKAEAGNLKPESGPRSLKTKQAELENKRWCETVRRFREDVLDEAPIGKLPDWETAVSLAAIYGMGPMDGEFGDFEKLNKQPEGNRLAAAAALLWESTRGVLAGELSYLGPVTRYPAKDEVPYARQFAGLIGYDLDGLYATVCGEKGYRTPASWGLAAAAASPGKRQEASAKGKEGSGKGKTTGARVGEPEAAVANEHGVFTKPTEDLHYVFAGTRVDVLLAVDARGLWHWAYSLQQPKGVGGMGSGHKQPSEETLLPDRGSALVEALEAAMSHYDGQAEHVTGKKRAALHAVAAAIRAELKKRRCLACGCTEDRACVDDGSGKACHWVSRPEEPKQVCSRCVED